MELIRPLLLWSVFSSIVCCDWLRHATYLSERSLRLLPLMGRTDDCLKRFPHRMYTEVQKLQVQSQLVFITENLRLLSELHGDFSQSDDRNLTSFLQILEEQTVQLNQCISTEKGKNGEKKYLTSLRKRFKRYRNASRDKIRCETRVQLQRLHILLASMAPPAGNH